MICHKKQKEDTMKKFLLPILCIIAALCFCLIACNDDPENPDGTDDPPYIPPYVDGDPYEVAEGAYYLVTLNDMGGFEGHPNEAIGLNKDKTGALKGDGETGAVETGTMTYTLTFTATERIITITAGDKTYTGGLVGGTINI